MLIPGRVRYVILRFVRLILVCAWCARSRCVRFVRMCSLQRAAQPVAYRGSCVVEVRTAGVRRPVQDQVSSHFDASKASSMELAMWRRSDPVAFKTCHGQICVGHGAWNCHGQFQLGAHQLRGAARCSVACVVLVPGSVPHGVHQGAVVVEG